MLTSFTPQVSFGHFLTLQSRTSGMQSYYFQNFYLNETVPFTLNQVTSQYQFLPFGFSGVTVNRSGDNQQTQLAFPNNTLSKAWASNAARDNWVATVHMMLLDPTNKTNVKLLSTFAGQVTSAIWSASELRVELSSVIDAVGNDVPRRRITEDVFGPLPTTSNVRLS